MASAAAFDTIQHRGEFEYPIQVWYFNLSVLAVGLATNTVFSIWAKIAPQFRGGHNSAAREAASIRRLPAALLTAWRIVAFRWRFPLGGTTGVSVFEVFVVLIYIAALLIWEFVHTDNLNPDFWSNKAAHIMAAQLNILPALSAKNNIIGYIIGVSYEKLNFMHRAFGRYLYVFVWIHVWGRWLAWDHFTGDGYILAFAWQQVGAVAGVAYTIAIILSLRPIRRWSYEIFYYTHCVIIFIFVIAACIHTSTPGFAYYVWPIWVIWGFERIVRGLRYLILNVFCLPRTGAPSTAELVLITPNTVRVTLLRRMPLGWRAGQHAFLNFPSVSATCFESHPFSIASIPRRPSDDSDCEADELVFYVKARKGATRRIVDLAKRKPGVRVQANIDGPYGRPTDLRPYRTCLLIAGGTGVSYTLPLFLDTIKHASNLSSTRISRVHFVWAMRSRAFASGLAPILSRALASCPASLDVQLSIYITGTDEIEYEKNSRDLLEAGIPATSTATYSAANVSSTRRPSSQEDAAEMDVTIPTKQGRPDFRAIVREEIARGVGPLAIEGPHPLVSDVRAEVSHLVPGIQDVLRGGPTIHFHAETFAY